MWVSNLLLVVLYEQNDKSSFLYFVSNQYVPRFIQQNLGGLSVSDYEKLQAEKSNLQINMLLYLQCPASAVNPGSSLSFLEKFCQDISAQDGYLLSFMNQKSPSSLQHLALTSQLHGWKIPCSLDVSDNGRLEKKTSIWAEQRGQLTSPLLYYNYHLRRRPGVINTTREGGEHERGYGVGRSS
ncbi:hypothetical protein F2Q69_00040175 [Brassica cretica]|uniref:Uncharacterized protein n=1 Tax=Brassica cretica TaxID=69181 RepID=A0A8S9NBW0_BRACR|nr:hypothetical protein F2Q69_00040175 [Brassica cretica]